MKILELTLSAVDLDALRRYYLSVLGLRLVESAHNDLDRLSLQAGETRLNFVPAQGGTHPRYHFAFNIPPGRFSAAVDWLRQRGGMLADSTGEDQFHSEGWNADMVYFTDPQGNILELIARHTLPDSSGTGTEHTGSFNASEILGVSEIGVAADSVASSVSLLETRIPGLAVYSGGGSDSFTAVGDPHGLLIVVRAGRIWFPETGVPANLLPLGMLLQMEGGQMYRVTAPPFPFAIQSENRSTRV